MTKVYLVVLQKQLFCFSSSSMTRLTIYCLKHLKVFPLDYIFCLFFLSLRSYSQTVKNRLVPLPFTKKKTSLFSFSRLSEQTV